MKWTDKNINAIARTSDIDNESRVLDNALKQEQLDSNKQDRIERKKFSDKIFWMVVSFLSTVLLIVIVCAIKCIPFTLSDSVLIALLTTTTANVIGVYMIVAKYLFHTFK